MIATLCLLTCSLATAQVPSRSDWLLSPQFVRGLELVYTGSFVEDTLNGGIQRCSSYKLETTLLVLDATAQKHQVAIYTSLSRRTQLGTPVPGAPWSVRLEVAEVTPQGRVRGPAGLVAPLEGPPTVEWGALVEVPRARVGVQDSWVVAEVGRPPRTWRVAGLEVVNGASCVKLIGSQQSDDWDRPRGDSTAWQRRDTVWLSPQLGIAYRVERVLERRDPLRKEPTHRAVLRYDLDSRLTYPGKLFDDRADEIRQARKFWDEAVPLLRDPNQYRQPLEALLRRITAHLDNQPPTPYRKAVQQVQKRIDAARRGQTLPDLPATEEEVPTALTMGRHVPDAVVTDLISQQSVRLHTLFGRPLLLIFYNPESPIGVEVLRFGQALSEKYRPGLTVIGMAVSDNPEQVRKQHTEMRLSFPILDGQGLHQTFGVDTTPRLVLLDSDGVLRGGFTGWGAQTPREVLAELQRWLPR